MLGTVAGRVAGKNEAMAARSGVTAAAGEGRIGATGDGREAGKRGQGETNGPSEGLNFL